MKTLLILCGACYALFATACGPGAPVTPTEDRPDASEIKLPPGTGGTGGTGGSGGTNANCNGVPETGDCRDGVALYCDTIEGSLRQVDCAALGQSCVRGERGAFCESLTSGTTDAGTTTTADAGPGSDTDGGGTTSEACDGIVDYYGFCTNTNRAVWCDVDSDPDQIIINDCTAEGKVCGEDVCAFGAYCCDTSTNLCPALGTGDCAGDTARRCNGDTLVEQDCAAQGKVCGVDDCAAGAACCDPAPTIPPCTELGLAGQCIQDKVYWCSSNGTLHIDDCPSLNRTCQVNVCGNGAWCCDTP